MPSRGESSGGIMERLGNMEDWTFLQGSHCGNYSATLPGVCLLPSEFYMKNINCHETFKVNDLGSLWSFIMGIM